MAGGEGEKLKQLDPRNFLGTHLSELKTVESWLAGLGLGLISLGIATTFYFFNQYQDRFYHGLQIDSVELGGLTKQEALTKLQAQPTANYDFEVTIAVDDIKIASTAGQLAVHKNYQETVSQAFEVGRAGFPVTRIWSLLQLQLKPKSFTTPLSFNSKTAVSLIEDLAQKVDLEGKEPSANIAISGSENSIEIDPGQPGRQLDQRTTKAYLEEVIRNHNSQESIILDAPVASTTAVLDEAAVEQARERVAGVLDKKITFSANNVSFDLNDQEIAKLLKLPSGYKNDLLVETVTSWAAKTNRAAQDAKFEYDRETLEVSEFTPPQDGLKLDELETSKKLLSALEDVEKEPSSENSALDEKGEVEDENKLDRPVLLYDLAVEVTKPELELADTNDLGIIERIGYGDSEYDHSIPNRIYNVSLTSERINNTIVPPGEEFSFNRTLGEVSARTGFRSAYVIKDGQTILGDGGGVCQVSTTLFRSIINAGLPVSKRLQHSYRVSYYELNAKPGLDATVYSGNIDLRFVNDTGHHLLIRSQADSENLEMFIEIYGTSDGRTTEITTHEVWDPRPAPPPQYADTNTLPSGVVKQVDWAVGGIKARVINVVKDKDGEVIREEEYYSNYIPWSAKYLRGV